MRCLAFLFVFTLSISSAFAQVSMADFLMSANQDKGVSTAEAQLSYLQSKPYRLSPLQKLEFRTQLHEMSTDRQTYALRFSPANPWEMKSNNQYFTEYQTYLSIGKQLALKFALQARYVAWTDYLFFQEVQAIHSQNVQLIEKQLAIMQRQSASSFFDGDEYVKLKVELVDKVVDFEEASLDLSNQKTEINTLYPESFGQSLNANTGELISVSRIEVVLDSLKQAEVNSLLLRYQQQKLSVDNSRYKLEKNNINLGFVQTQYDERRAVPGRNPYNLSLGVTIPITNPNKSDMARQKLNAIESEYELKQTEVSEQKGKENSYARVKEVIGHYHALQAKIAELQKQNLAEDLTLMKGGDPLIRIRYEASINKLKMVETKLRYKVYAYYIDYLVAGDYLQQLPLTNYLTNNLQRIGSK